VDETSFTVGGVGDDHSHADPKCARAADQGRELAASRRDPRYLASADQHPQELATIAICLMIAIAPMALIIAAPISLIILAIHHLRRSPSPQAQQHTP